MVKVLAASSYVNDIPVPAVNSEFTLSSTLSFVKYKFEEPSDKLSVSNAPILTAMSSAFTVIPVPAPTFNVASPDVAVPVKPAPAFTPVMSPTLPVIVNVPAESSYDNDTPVPAVKSVFTWSSIASLAAVPKAAAVKSPELSITSVVPTVKPFLILKFCAATRMFLHLL